MEKRSPRATFSKKLFRLCERLDEAPTRKVEYVIYDIERKPMVTITSLWVVGSYARGSTECGDLDVLFEANTDSGGLPFASRIGKTFFGSLPLVRYYCGTPEDNSSGVAFPDAVRIWSGKGCDWKRANDSIQIDPTAGRAARETDCIPFRDEQLRIYWGESLEVARLINEGLLESEFIQFDSEMLEPLTADGISTNAKYCFKDIGRKSRELIPVLIRLMRRLEPSGTWLAESNSVFHCGGTQIRIGRPAIPMYCLEGSTDIRQLVLIPHLSSRGPNGAWVLRQRQVVTQLKTSDLE